MSLRVAVIGGGWAGLAAAVELAAADIPVTVFEAARTLGGRARSVVFKPKPPPKPPTVKTFAEPLRAAHNEISLDNGQHILLGAYRETLRLLQLVGADGLLLRLPLRLTFPGHFSLAAPRLPAPLHLLTALLRAEGLSGAERRAALAFTVKLRLANFTLARDIAVADLLQQHRQPPNVIRYLWEPLCLAALNTPLSEASAQVFLNVLRDAFAHRRADSDLLLPRACLGALFPERAAEHVHRHGGEVLTATGVDGISVDGDGFRLAIGGDSVTFSHVVCAVPPFRLAALLAGLPGLEEAVAMAGKFRYQPIYTVYLQYAQPVALPFPMLGLADGPGQWLFDWSCLHGKDGLLSVVISAAGPHQKLTQEELAAAVQRQLAGMLPGQPAPLWHKVIAEKRATFACTSGCERPPQRTPLANFYLAGDHTAGDYPATLEGAVRSGVLCARMVLRSAG